MPLMLKEEAFETNEEEEKEIDRLQARIDYCELFAKKFGAFKQEMDAKVDYANAEYESLKSRSEKLLQQYGCNPDMFKPKDLFELMYNFAQDFSESFKRL